MLSLLDSECCDTLFCNKSIFDLCLSLFNNVDVRSRHLLIWPFNVTFIGKCRDTLFALRVCLTIRLCSTTFVREFLDCWCCFVNIATSRLECYKQKKLNAQHTNIYLTTSLITNDSILFEGSESTWKPFQYTCWRHFCSLRAQTFGFREMNFQCHVLCTHSSLESRTGRVSCSFARNTFAVTVCTRSI